MSRWFRHYAGMMRDDKLVRVAIRSKQTIERVVWVWGAILESAAEIDDDGRYDFDAAEAAYFLRADEMDVAAIVDELCACGRLGEGCVAKWGDRQFKSDRSAERQSRYRERHRKADSASVKEECERDSNGEVTSPSRHGDAPETETETEEESPNGDSRSDDRLTPEHVFEGYQDLARAICQPVPRDLTPERRQLTKGRINQYSLDDFLTVFAKCRDSPFLRGDRGRTPLAYDWLMKKANFQKVLEGNYDR